MRCVFTAPRTMLFKLKPVLQLLLVLEAMIIYAFT